MLRATILQNRHEFDAAIADLDRILKREPRHAQALLTRATVLTVRGKFAEARADCDRLAALAPAIYATTCTAAIDSVTGNASRAYESLRRTLEGAARRRRRARWAETLLGEIAHRRGDPAAERHFRAALVRRPTDLYLLGAYSDWLLDQKRADDVIALVGKRDARRRAVAAPRLGATGARGRPEAAATIETLRARFEASRARGDSVHQRENARFELALRDDPKRASR